MKGTCWKENIGEEKDQQAKERSQKEGERLKRSEGVGSEGERDDGEREDLLWIVICHVHPPVCSYTRVLLLILNRC